MTSNGNGPTPTYTSLTSKWRYQSLPFAEGAYLTFTNNASITKPVIIANGFGADSNGSQVDLQNMHDYLNSAGLLTSLVDNGYDVVIMGYNDPLNFIQANGLLCATLVADLAPQTQDIIVIGVSMGGLVTRYGLMFLAQQGITSNVSTWMTWDSPHYGANVSLGLQYAARAFQDVWEEVSVLQAVLLTQACEQMLLNWSEESTPLQTKPSSGNVTVNPAASPAFGNLQSDFTNLGTWPSVGKRLAVVSGNGQGQSQSFSPGSELLTFSGSGLSCSLYALPSSTSETSETSEICQYTTLHSTAAIISAQNALPLDSIPGSLDPQIQNSMVPGHGNFIDTLAQIAQNNGCAAKVSNDGVTFIPSTSAAGIQAQLLGDYTQEIPASNSVFTAIYTEATSQPHVAVNPGNTAWILQQLGVPQTGGE